MGLLCVIFALTISMANAQKMAENIQAPIAKIIPKTLVKHNHTRIDNYYWLNERENPEVITYLNQENEYYNAKTADTKEFQKELFQVFLNIIMALCGLVPTVQDCINMMA